MSGGSHNYMYQTFRDMYENEMEDRIMNELIIDLSEVLYILEWWKSHDTGEETYRKAVKEFKDKYFHNIDKLKEKLIEEIKQEAIKEIQEL